MKKTDVKLSIFIRGLAKVWLYINRFSFVVPSSVLIYLLFTLLLYASHGFEITDDSYYLLWAIQPENVLQGATQFGYYTKWLYLLSGRDIAVFRILGILVLSSAGFFFATALDRYWSVLSKSNSNIRIQWETITLILIGNLTLYHRWWITPSYNWFALISVLLVATGLLRVATSGLRHQVQSNWSKFYFIINALLVGVGGGLAFLAKPTTALILALITICWIAVHLKSFQCWSFWVISFSAACLVLLFHALSFKGGVMPYYNELREIAASNGNYDPNYSYNALIFGAYFQIVPIVLLPFRVIRRIIKYYPWVLLLFPFVMWLILRLINRYRDSTVNFVLSWLLVFSVLGTWSLLWDTRFWKSWTIGEGGLRFSLVLLLLAWLTSFVWRKNRGKHERIRFNNLIILYVFLLMVAFATDFGNGNGLPLLLLLLAWLTSFVWRKNRGKHEPIRFSNLIILYVFLFMLAFATAFGTNDGITVGMSHAYVCFAAAVLYTGRWIDQYVEKRILGTIIPILTALSVLLTMNHAINNPFRFPDKIREMKVESTFFAATGSLFVDKKTANYIKDLKRIALNAGWEPGTPLLDWTGGSAGANVILGGRILAKPAFFGHFKSTGALAKDMLNMCPRSELDAAWILTAPSGSIKLPEDILPEIGLNFPKGYKVVGTAITGHRDEFQVLWKPLNHHAGGSDVGL